MPHLNNQMGIRARSVNDCANLVNCAALFICTYTKESYVHSKHKPLRDRRKKKTRIGYDNLKKVAIGMAI